MAPTTAQVHDGGETKDQQQQQQRRWKFTITRTLSRESLGGNSSTNNNYSAVALAQTGDGMSSTPLSARAMEKQRKEKRGMDSLSVVVHHSANGSVVECLEVLDDLQHHPLQYESNSTEIYPMCTPNGVSNQHSRGLESGAEVMNPSTTLNVPEAKCTRGDSHDKISASRACSVDHHSTSDEKGEQIFSKMSQPESSTKHGPYTNPGKQQ